MNYTVSESINGPTVAVFVSVEMILSLLSNSAILLLTIYSYKSLKQPATIFFTVVILSNLLTTMFFMPFTVITAAAGEWIFGQTMEQRDDSCQFVGIVFAYGFGVSIQMLAVISVDRFLFIVKPTLHKRVMKTWVAIVIAIIICIEAFLVVLTPFVGLGEYQFSPAVATCVPVWVGQTNYVIFFSVIGAFIFLVIAITSTWTFCFTRNFIKRQRDIQINNHCNSTKHIYDIRIRNLIGIFGVLLVVMCICFTPYGTILIIGFIIGFSSIPDQVYTLVLILFLSYTVSVPLVQAYFRPDIHKPVITFLKKFSSVTSMVCQLYSIVYC